MKITLRAIPTIALNSFREAIRSKVLATLVFFAVLFSISAVLLGQLSMHEEQRVTTNAGLFLSTMFSVAIAVYTMVTSLHTELERRTIYTLLSKPIHRWHFLIGKYFGVMLLMAVVVLGMMILCCALLLAQGFELTHHLFIAFGAIYLQLAIVTALATAIASFSSPLLTGMITAAVFILGNLVSLAEDVAPMLKPVLGADLTNGLLGAIWLVVPNFEQLNLSGAVVYQFPISAHYVGSALAYTATEVAILLLIASVVFQRREFA